MTINLFFNFIIGQIYFRIVLSSFVNKYFKSICTFKILSAYFFIIYYFSKDKLLYTHPFILLVVYKVDL